MKEKWPKDLYCALFITHRLFLDFGSLLHPLAGGRQAGGRALGWDKISRYGSTKYNRRESRRK